MKEQIEEQSNYFVLFPMYLLDELSAKRCVLAGLLISLAKKDGYAYIGNQTLSNIMRCSVEMLQKDLKYLEDKGYIQREVIRNDNNEIVLRKIYPLQLLIRQPIVINDVTLPSKMNDTYSNKLPNNSINSISIKDKDKYNSEFNEIWILYCKKGNKVTSFKSWQRLSSQDRIDVINSISSYVENHKDANKLEYLPHLSTYLNQQRWKDSLPYEIKNKNEKIHDIKWS